MKILLVEGNPTLSEKLAQFLTVHRCVVDIAADGAIALGMEQQRAYDVILLDIALPDLSVVDLCRRLRKQGCTTRIVMLAAQASADTVIQCLEAGADDFVTRPVDLMPFLVRLKAWQRRHHKAFADSVLSWDELKLDPNQLRVTYRGRELHLSPKQYSLLELFLRNPQRIFSRDAILDKLWTFDACPSTGAVTNLVKDLRLKLKAAGVVDRPIKTLHGLGYQLNLPPTKPQKPSPTVAQPLEQPDLTQIVDTFQTNLRSRLTLIGAAAAALEQDALTPEILQQAKAAAHQLASGLSALGYGQGAYIVRAIEQWLAEPATLSPAKADELNHLLRRLHYILTQPPSFEPFAAIPEASLSEAPYKPLTFVP